MVRPKPLPAVCSGILILLWLAPVALRAADKPPVKVFILAGQSNMQGQAKVDLLKYQLTQPATRERFQQFQKDDQWVERDDVWISYADRKGKLTVGYGANKDMIGPELQFGFTVGDHYDQQVLIIKTAWGGRSLYRDFRPPGSGLPPEEKLQAELEKNPDATMDDVKALYGASYRQMMDEIQDALKNIGEYFPDYEGQGYELAGFVWFQGWNDMINPEYTAAYTENMVNFIRDVRKDLSAPKLPFVIGQMGVDGVQETPNPKHTAFKDAQAAAAELPEFQGNVAVVKTDRFWDMDAEAVFKKGWREHPDEWSKVGSNWPFHYLGSAKTFCDIGRAFGEAVIKLNEK